MFQKLIFLFTITSLISGCLSPKTKREVILPAAIYAWPGVREDLERGINAYLQSPLLSPEAADALLAQILVLDRSLKNKDLNTLRSVNWLELAPWAEKGIEEKILSGEISPRVAESLRERLLNFTHVMGMMQPSYVALPASDKKTYYVKVPGVPATVYAGTDPKALVIMK